MIILLILFAVAGPDETRVEFRQGSNFFRAIKSSKEFSFSSRVGTQSVDIKACNREVVKEFWDELVQNTVKTGSHLPANEADTWVEYDGIRSPVFDFESKYQALMKVPRQVHVVFAESVRLCSKN